MNPESFLQRLPEVFEDFPRSEHPIDRRLESIATGVENLARENNLALLNLAASCLDPGESYVEIGVFHGASLIGAMIGNEDKSFVGIDTFEFRDASLELVERNLEHFGLSRPELIVGDVFDLAAAGRLSGLRVGVWYYDALHTYEAQLAGLRAAESFLAPGALVIVDDSDWERVARAIDDYLVEQRRARRILSIDGSERGQPHWWEGVQVLCWDG
jgi:predicted O-methyltransferase YrrM